MMERRQIVALAAQSQDSVLITLTHAEGSTYRQPGARLLTATDLSTYAGSISGGCLEASIVKKASWMTRAGAVTERYAMTFDDTSEIPFGLGCGGIVDVLFEPVQAPEGQALVAAFAASLSGTESVVISFLPGEGRPLRRLIFAASGEIIFASPQLSDEKITCARALTPGKPYSGRIVERLLPPQRLVILGAGDDAIPVSRVASILGWTVHIVDGRAPLARAERFPLAEQVIALTEGHDVSSLRIAPQDAVILMTHSFEQDRDLLVKSLQAAPRYLGLLGARHRSSLLISEAAALLERSVDECCASVFAPVGMDLGGDGPESIALSIVAEIQAVLHGRLGTSRRLTPSEIASHLERGGSSRYLRAHCALDNA